MSYIYRFAIRCALFIVIICRFAISFVWSWITSETIVTLKTSHLRTNNSQSITNQSNSADVSQHNPTKLLIDSFMSNHGFLAHSIFIFKSVLLHLLRLQAKAKNNSVE